MDPTTIARMLEALSDPIQMIAFMGGIYLVVRVWRRPRADPLLQRTAEAVSELHDRTAELRHELAEVHERLDFAERMLVRGEGTPQDAERALSDTPV